MENCRDACVSNGAPHINGHPFEGSLQATIHSRCLIESPSPPSPWSTHQSKLQNRCFPTGAYPGNLPPVLWEILCMVGKLILHPFETMVESSACWYLQQNRIIPGILRCRIASIHSITTQSWNLTTGGCWKTTFRLKPTKLPSFDSRRRNQLHTHW